SPLYRHYARKLNVETADSAANSNSGATTGVEYYRTHNDNATGLRLLVKNSSTGAIRELTGSYTVLPTSGNSQFNLTWPNSQAYKNKGMNTSTEVPYGIRAYPGNYFFEQISMQASDVLSLRTFNDTDQPSQPANPNTGQSANRNVRFWIGHAAQGN